MRSSFESVRPSFDRPRPSFGPGPASASGLPGEEYFLQRSIPQPRTQRSGAGDFPDGPNRPLRSFAELWPPSRGSTATAPRGSSVLYSALRSSVHAQNLHTEVQDVRGINAQVLGDKEMLKHNYEEFIRRLQAENEELKRAEQRLMQVSSLKRGLEVELTQVASQLAVFQHGSDDPLVERLKRMVQELHAEKAELRRQLEQNKLQINELITNVTTVRHASDGEARALREQLSALQSSYNRVVEEYRLERGRPIQVPDSPDLKRLLEEKIIIIDQLQAKIRFLDDQLRIRGGPCAVCPGKDAAIGQLQGRVRDLEQREQRRSVSYLPARQEVVHTSTSVYPAFAARVEQSPVAASRVRSSSATRLGAASAQHACCSTICICLPCHCSCQASCCGDCGEECAAQRCCGAEGHRAEGRSECVSSERNLVTSTNVTETVTTTTATPAPVFAQPTITRVATAPVSSMTRAPTISYAQGGVVRSNYVPPNTVTFAGTRAPSLRPSLSRESPQVGYAKTFGEQRGSATAGAYPLRTAPAVRYTTPEPLQSGYRSSSSLHGYTPRAPGLTATAGGAETYRLY